eukprot:g1208.t1
MQPSDNTPLAAPHDQLTFGGTPGSGGHVPNVKLGEKQLFGGIGMSDGSQGIRGAEAAGERLRGTAWPAAASIGMSWDPEFAYVYGRALAKEFRMNRINTILGPCEDGRHHYVSSAPLRAVFELQLKNWAAALAMGGNAVMCAYNWICGHADEKGSITKKMCVGNCLNKWSLSWITDLSERFYVMSDWGATGSAQQYGLIRDEWPEKEPGLVGAHGEKLTSPLMEFYLRAGFSSEQGGTEISGQPLRPSFEEVQEKAAGRIVATMEDVEKSGPNLLTEERISAADYEALKKKHARVAARLVADSIVLLKNEKRALPLLLRPEDGADAVVLRTYGCANRQGGYVSPGEGDEAGTVSIADALRDAATEMRQSGFEIDYSAPDQLLQNPLSLEPQADVSDGKKRREVVLLCVAAADLGMEGTDRKSLDLALTAITKTGEEDPHRFQVVMFVVSPGYVRLSKAVVDSVDAILLSIFPGHGAGRGLVRVLFNESPPSAKLSFTIADEGGTQYSPELYANAEAFALHPGNLLDYTKTDGEDGMQTGYRWYQAHKVEPLFPFGHGLTSLADWTKDFRVSVKKHDPHLRRISFCVDFSLPDGVGEAWAKLNAKAGRGRNVVKASPVVQFFVKKQKPDERPYFELLAFAKLANMKPAEKRCAAVFYTEPPATFSPGPRKYVSSTKFELFVSLNGFAMGSGLQKVETVEVEHKVKSYTLKDYYDFAKETVMKQTFDLKRWPALSTHAQYLNNGDETLRGGKDYDYGYVDSDVIAPSADWSFLSEAVSSRHAEERKFLQTPATTGAEEKGKPKPAATDESENPAASESETPATKPKGSPLPIKCAQRGVEKCLDAREDDSLAHAPGRACQDPRATSCMAEEEVEDEKNSCCSPKPNSAVQSVVRNESGVRNLARDLADACLARLRAGDHDDVARVLAETLQLRQEAARKALSKTSSSEVRKAVARWLTAGGRSLGEVEEAIRDEFHLVGGIQLLLKAGDREITPVHVNRGGRSAAYAFYLQHFPRVLQVEGVGGAAEGRVYAAAIESCSRVGNFDAAWALFSTHTLTGEWEFVYTAILAACAKHGKPSQAVEVVGQLMAAGTGGGTSTTAISGYQFAHAIRACAQQWRTAVRLLAQAEQMRKTPPSTSAKMSSKSRNHISKASLAVCFSSAMDACLACGRWREALELFYRGRREHSISDLHLYGLALKACQRAAAWREAVGLLGEMREHLLLKVATTTSTGESLPPADNDKLLPEDGDKTQSQNRDCPQSINHTNRRSFLIATASAVEACAKAGQWSTALQLLEDDYVRPHLDAALVIAGLHACEAGGLCDKAAELVKRLKMQPPLPVFTAAFRACAARAAPEATSELWDMMLVAAGSRGILHPDALGTLNAAANAFERAGRMDRVEEILSSVVTIVEQVLLVQENAGNNGAIEGDDKNSSSSSSTVTVLHAIPLLGRFRVFAPELVRGVGNWVRAHTMELGVISPLVFSNFCWGLHLLTRRVRCEPEIETESREENLLANVWLDKNKFSDRKTISDWVRVVDSVVSDQEALLESVLAPVVSALQGIMQSGPDLVPRLRKLTLRDQFQSLGDTGTRVVLRRLGLLGGEGNSPDCTMSRGEKRVLQPGGLGLALAPLRPPRAADICARVTWRLGFFGVHGSRADGDLHHDHHHLCHRGTETVSHDLSVVDAKAPRLKWPETVRGYRSRDCNASHAEITAIRRILAVMSQVETAEGAGNRNRGIKDVDGDEVAVTSGAVLEGRACALKESESSMFGNHTPVSDNRKSLAPGSSLKHLSGRMAKMKDPRMVFDKSFMLSAVKQISVFLTSTGYPHSLSPKFIQGPSGKEFYGLMQFLFSQIDPNTPLTKKMDEELPEALQRIRYPMNVTKASLLLVGAPTTWPLVLGCLHWVVELLSIDMKLIQPYLRGEEPLLKKNTPADGKKAPSWIDLEWRRRFDILARTYKAFLHGQDEIVQELHGEKRAQAESTRKARENTLLELAQERNSLEARLAEAEKRPRLAEMKDRVARLRTDVVKKKSNLSSEKRKLQELQEQLTHLKTKADASDREQRKLETEKERLDKVRQRTYA